MMKKDKVFVIAEISANHGGKLEIAKASLDAVKRTGADAVKFQTYTADTITLDAQTDDFKIKGGTIWDGKYLHDLYKEAHMPWSWQEELFEYAKELGLVCFSSPFDFTAVDFLEKLDCPIYKIASFEINDIPLIRYVAQKKKPMIISTGVATKEDIVLALETCYNAGNKDVQLLKCTSSYPATLEDANLALLPKMASDFKVPVGLSDHTIGVVAPMVAISLGARVIEKHFILDKSIGGPDVTFSLDESEFTELVKAVRDVEASLGEAEYKLKESQLNSRQFMRSLYASQNIEEGEEFTALNVKSVRPSYGLHTKYYSDLLGTTCVKGMKKGEPVQNENITISTD